MADGVKEAFYMRGIPMFLISSSAPMGIQVYEDKKGAIDLAANPLSSCNSMYLDARHHILREMASSGDISVEYIQSDDQHADIVTKTLDSLESPIQ